MWIMTPVGFFSIVQKPGDGLQRQVTVRARVKADLLALQELALPKRGPINAHEGSDYAYLATAPQAHNTAVQSSLSHASALPQDDAFGGCEWTFAKRRPNPGEAPAQTALREVAEETGVQAVVVGHLPYVYGGSTSTTAYAVMRDSGQHGAWDSETAAICWVSLDEAQQLIHQTTVPMGRQRDLQVLADLRRWLQDHPGMGGLTALSQGEGA